LDRGTGAYFIHGNSREMFNPVFPWRCFRIDLWGSIDDFKRKKCDKCDDDQYDDIPHFIWRHLITDSFPLEDSDSLNITFLRLIFFELSIFTVQDSSASVLILSFPILSCVLMCVVADG